MITHLVNPDDFDRGEAAVEGDAYRHLFRARRLARGDRVRLVDGHGRARWAEVAAVDRRRAVLVLGGDAPSNEAARSLELLVAALKPERAAWLVEKATELGVAAVRFLESARTPRRYGSGNLERWRRVAAAALCQCHRARLPEVSGVHAWDEVPELLGRAAESWYLHPGEREPPDSPSPSGVRGERGAVLVGPEGGWSAAEAAELEGLGARPVALGPRVLRVETAALAAAVRFLLPSW